MATCSRCSSSERIPALRPLAETLERIHDQGGIAIAAHPMAPLIPSLGSRSLLWSRGATEPRHRLDAIELMNPSTAGRSRRGARERLNAEVLHLAAVGNSDAHVLEGIGLGVDLVPRIRPRPTTARPSRAARPARMGRTGRHLHNVDVYRRQLRAKARHLRHTLRPTGEWR